MRSHIAACSCSVITTGSNMASSWNEVGGVSVGPVGAGGFGGGGGVIAAVLVFVGALFVLGAPTVGRGFFPFKMRSLIGMPASWAAGRKKAMHFRITASAVLGKAFAKVS